MSHRFLCAPHCVVSHENNTCGSHCLLYAPHCAVSHGIDAEHTSLDCRVSWRGRPSACCTSSSAHRMARSPTNSVECSFRLSYLGLSDVCCATLPYLKSHECCASLQYLKSHQRGRIVSSLLSMIAALIAWRDRSCDLSNSCIFIVIAPSSVLSGLFERDRFNHFQKL